MTHLELAKEVYQVAHLTGEFKLRSGQISHEYFDKYRFEARPQLLGEIATHLAPLIPPGTEVLAGLEMGGIPIATALSLKTGIPMVLVRKEAKNYGTCRLAEGLDIKGLKVCVVEDVITTGGQVILSANDLRKEGALVENVVCVIERGADAADKLKASGLKIHSLFTKTELDQFTPTT